MADQATEHMSVAAPPEQCFAVVSDLERYPEAFLLPLSMFDPHAIPDPAGRAVVFACRSGNRSVTASLAAQAAGLPYDAHLAGGIKAWKAAGLPTET